MKRFLISLALLTLASCSTENPPLGIEQLSADGRTVIINYWAIWCAPCREEIPELNEFAAEHADRVAVYAVNFDGVMGEQLLQQAGELGIEFALLEEDPAAELGYARPTVLPTTLFISADGEVLQRLLGPQTLADLEQALQ